MPNRLLPALTLTTLTLGAASAASAQTGVFDAGGDGFSFRDPLNWSPDVVPDGFTESASIGSGGAFDVVLTRPQLRLNTLAVGGDDTLTLANGADIGLVGDLVNDGRITLAGVDDTTELEVVSDLSIRGTGTIVLGSGVNPIVGNVNVLGGAARFSTPTLTHAAGHTIRGRGVSRVGRGATNIVNEGLIVSDVGGRLLLRGRETIRNAGTISTTPGGELIISSVTLDNTGGVIDARNGGITLSGGVTLTGDSTILGTLLSAGSGNRLSTLTTTGEIRVNGGSDLAVDGVVTNGGVISLAGAGPAELLIDGDVTLEGGGSLLLGPDGFTSGNNLIGARPGDGTATLTNGVDHSIITRASGELGRGTTDVSNAGAIVANGGQLVVDTRLGLFNTGEISTRDGGGIRFREDLINVGTLTTGTGTRIDVDGEVLGSGLLRGDGALAADALRGAFTVAPGSDDGAIGALTIEGEVDLTSSILQIDLAAGHMDRLDVAGAVTLGGVLSVTLQGPPPAATEAFTLLQADTLSAAFTNIASGGRLATDDGAGSFFVSYGPGSAFGTGSVVLSGFVPVPEPGIAGLAAAGLALLGRRRRVG